jgi:2-keto-3-deoxy-L-rhamnonate aldolase RhmA
MVLPLPWHAQLLAELGFAFVWLDLEHGWFSGEQLQCLALIARQSGVDVIVRVPRDDLSNLGKVLELGASAVMISHIESVEQVAEAAKFALYPPLGERGYSGVGADAMFGLDTKAAILSRVAVSPIIAQIETIRGVEAADEICNAKGVGAVMVGRADLSVDADCEIELSDPTMRAMLEAVAQSADQAEMRWGTLIREPSELEQLSALGAAFVAFGSPIPRIARMFRDLSRELALETPWT